MTQGDVPPSLSLSYYSDVLRRSWWIVLLAVLLGLGLAFSYLSFAPRVASATASVSVHVISTDPFNASRSASGLIDSAGEAQVASSYAVAAQAAEQLGGDYTAQSVRESVQVTGVPDTAILHVTASASTPTEARNVANAVASEYLAYRSEQAQNRIARTLEASGVRLQELQAELRDVDELLAEAEEGSRAATQAQSDRSLLTLQINAVVSQAASAESIDTTGGTILSPADQNPVRWNPRRGLVLMSGALAGGGLGLIGVFVLQAFASRVRSVPEVIQHGGRTVLAALSQRRVSLPPTGKDLSDLRTVRERLLADHRLEKRTGVLVVIDQTGSPHPSAVPVSLAFVLALSGVEVEYVPLGGTDAAALTTRLQLETHPEQPEVGVRYRSRLAPSLSVLDPQGLRAAPTEETISSVVLNAVQMVRREKLVILDASAQTSDATRLAACRSADAGIVLVALRSTQAAALLRVTQDVRIMGADVMGSILLDRRRRLEPEPNGRVRHPTSEASGDHVEGRARAFQIGSRPD